MFVNQRPGTTVVSNIIHYNGDKLNIASDIVNAFADLFSKSNIPSSCVYSDAFDDE